MNKTLADLRLTPKERALLEILLQNAGRIVTQTDLLDRLWDETEAPTPELLRVHVKNLRRALDDRQEPRLLETVRGVGYRLNWTKPYD